MTIIGLRGHAAYLREQGIGLLSKDEAQRYSEPVRAFYREQTREQAQELENQVLGPWVTRKIHRVQ